MEREAINEHCRRVAIRAAASGSVASIVSASALAVCSQIEEGSPAGALNGPSQWVWGEEEARTRRADWRHTALGYAIHHASSIFWAVAYEATCSVRSHELSAKRVLSQAAATAALAWFVDYHVAPRRLRPGFRKHLGNGSLIAVYGAFALGLVATTAVLERRNRQSSTSTGDC